MKKFGLFTFLLLVQGLAYSESSLNKEQDFFAQRINYPRKSNKKVIILSFGITG